MPRQGLLLVVSGPSGVGKGTIIRELIARQPSLAKSISCTTRDPRQGEREGCDYYFVPPDEFARMHRHGQLLEWATVHQDISYGTPRKPVDDSLAAGRDIVLEVDYQGARSVRAQMGGRAVLVFIAPPSWDELRRRLVSRETESDDQVRKRLRTAMRELANMDLFQYVVVNDDLGRAVDELEAILVAEGQRIGRVAWSELREQFMQQAQGHPR